MVGVAANSIAHDLGPELLIELVGLGEPLIRPYLHLPTVAGLGLGDDVPKERKPRPQPPGVRVHVKPFERAITPDDPRIILDAREFSGARDRLGKDVERPRSDGEALILGQPKAMRCRKMGGEVIEIGVILLRVPCKTVFVINGGDDGHGMDFVTEFEGAEAEHRNHCRLRVMPQSRAIVFSGPEQVEVLPVEIPEPGPGQLLVRTELSQISAGTEMRCLRGDQPGMTDWGFIPGYIATGEVVAVGLECHTPLGTRVTHAGTTASDRPRLWGGQCGLALVSESEAIPVGTVPLDRVGLCHLGAIARRGVLACGQVESRRVAVIGLGPIGQWSARLFAAAGAHVTGCDLDPRRRSALERDGISTRIDPGPDFEIVVEATGNPAGPRWALEWLRPLGWDEVPAPGARQIVIQASYPGDISVPYQEAFSFEARIHIPRHRTNDDLRAVMDLVGKGGVATDGIAPTVFSVGDAPGVYRRLLDRDPELLSVAFDWR